MEKFLDTVLATIKAASDRLSARIEAVEKREPVPGRDGRDGAQGPIGDRGEKGETGDRGLPGVVGAIGPQGLQGEKGDRGEIGSSGAIGPQGPPGATGAPGERGERGLQGDPGTVGPEGPQGQPGRDGKDAEPPDVEAIAIRAAALLPKPAAPDLSPIAELQAEMVLLKAQVAAVPVVPSHAELLTMVAHVVSGEVQKAMAAYPVPKDGEPGTSVDPAAVEAMVVSHVTKTVAAIPTPRDGQSVTVADVTPVIASEVEKAVRTIPPPKDGVGIVGALIDRDGQLVVTLSDGGVKNVGRVVGRDVDVSDVARIIAEELAKWPRPVNGQDGANGVDGLGFDDLDTDYDEHGRMYLRFSRGEITKRFRLPCHVDRGVYRETHAYLKGDGVTWAGSFWIAQQDGPPGKPGTNDSGWRMSVKRGGDGKQGLKGDQGPQGPKGDKGDRGPGQW